MKNCNWTWHIEMMYTETYRETMVEPSFWMRVIMYEIPFPNVNVNSIWRSYNRAGLSKTTGAECPEVTMSLIHITWKKSAQCPVLILAAYIQPLHRTKWRWLSNKTFSPKTIMWMLYWYNVQNNFLYDIISYDTVNALSIIHQNLGGITLGQVDMN